MHPVKGFTTSRDEQGGRHGGAELCKGLWLGLLPLWMLWLLRVSFEIIGHPTLGKAWLPIESDVKANASSARWAKGFTCSRIICGQALRRHASMGSGSHRVAPCWPSSSQQ